MTAIRIDVQDGDYPAPPSIVITPEIRAQILGDVVQRLEALENAHAIVADVKRHTDACTDGVGRFIRDRITDFEARATDRPAPDGEIAAPVKGDYVLATKYEDGEAWDWWGLGWLDSIDNGRFMVVDSDGKQTRGNGYRRCRKISRECGNWLWAQREELERTGAKLWDLVASFGSEQTKDHPAGDDGAVSNVISVLFALRRHGYRDEADLLQKYSASLRVNLAQAEHQRDAWKAAKEIAEEKLEKAEVHLVKGDGRETETRNALRAAGIPDSEAYPDEDVSAWEKSLRAAGRMVSTAEGVKRLASERDTLAARVAELEANSARHQDALVSEYNGKANAARAEADALRAERDALKARKVKLPSKASPDSLFSVKDRALWGGAIDACAAAIRAAGVGVS